MIRRGIRPVRIPVFFFIAGLVFLVLASDGLRQSPGILARRRSI